MGHYLALPSASPPFLRVILGLLSNSIFLTFAQIEFRKNNMSKTIVVADDQQDIRRLIRITLGYGNYITTEASNAHEALHLIREHRADLAILDVIMPGPVNGLQLCEKLKSDPETTALPVILVSGEDSESARRAAAQAGCDLYISKPFQPLRLIESVERLLHPPVF